jgi:hypothetical protein
MKKGLKALVAAMVFVLVMLPCKTVFADDGWGSFGDNIKWHFYESTGTLQIEGEGRMPGDGQEDDDEEDDDEEEDEEDEDDDDLGIPWSSYKDSIKTVKIGKGITSISEYAFEGYGNLTEVTIPGTVTTIGRMAFYETGLKKLDLPEGVTTLGWMAFAYCTNLKSVEIPGTMKSVGSSAFSRCSNVTSIKLSEGVETLESSCFSGTGITTIDIPSSVKKIASAFSFCKQLDHITIPSTVKWVGGDMCFSCSALRYVVFNAQCAIEKDAFGGCDNLVAVKLGEGVTAINYFSFWNSKKLSVMFVPASVQEINAGAFYAGTGSVTFYGYTDTAAYDYAGQNQFVKFVDVSAQGMTTWEKAWDKAVKKQSTSTSASQKSMKFTSVKATKGAKKITGKMSVSGATVKVKIGNAAYKKATVKGKNFSIKSSKLKKGTIIRIRVTKSGYKTLSKLIKVK